MSIQNRADLKFYLDQDLKRFDGNKPSMKDWILHNESWFIFHYQKHLRYVEYYINRKNRSLLFLYHFLRYKRLGFRLKFSISPNTIQEGLRVFHAGDCIRIKPNCRIGKKCTLLPGVVIGNKNLENDDTWVTAGDNCYFGLGAKVFGEVHIGSNVVIGANSVVTKDIPDNCVVAGNPAKIIKMKER